MSGARGRLPPTTTRPKARTWSGLHYAPVDVTDSAALERHAPAFDRLDVLVLSQGTVLYRRGEFTAAGFAQVVQLNLNSLMNCALTFHPLLKASKGSLITISSTAAFHATRGNPAYNASKAGAVGLTRAQRGGPGGH
jgi:3-oxoacyl-[acyl-carrier protein] reductase